jgi:hypothetical protein
MNVEIGTEAAQFPEKEYINGIFLAVGLESQVVRDFGSCVVGGPMGGQGGALGHGLCVTA